MFFFINHLVFLFLLSTHNGLMHTGAFSWAACRTITLTSPSGCREVPTPQREKKKSTKRRKDTSDPPPTSPLLLLIIAQINCRQKAFHQDPAPRWWIGNRGINELRVPISERNSLQSLRVLWWARERKKKGALKVTEHIFFTFWRPTKQPGLSSLAVYCGINSLGLLLVSKHITHVFSPDRLQLLVWNLIVSRPDKIRVDSLSWQLFRHHHLPARVLET